LYGLNKFTAIYFTPVGLGGDPVRRMFVPLIATDPDAAAGELVAV
jgi:hypothetical protein